VKNNAVDKDEDEQLTRMSNFLVDAYTNVVRATHIAVDVDDPDIDDLLRVRSILRNFLNVP
jgi:hypothetical protein